jgi:hypothetical protein
MNLLISLDEHEFREKRKISSKKHTYRNLENPRSFLPLSSLRFVIEGIFSGAMITPAVHTA